MHQLITLSQSTINQEMVQTVNARELHDFLQSRQQFADWIKNRIADYDFIENQDFVCVSENYETQRTDGQRGIATRKEYHITLDMAKELSMVERNEQGKMARRYFIDCEKQLKANQQMIPTDESKMRALAFVISQTSLSDVAKETLLITSAENALGICIDYRPQVEQTTYSAKEIGEKLGISANKVGRLATAHNLKTDEFGRYVLDKSPSSAKQVETFRYFDSAIPVIQALLSNNH